MKILYVEDEPAHVALTRRTLEENPGQRVGLLHAETIAEALGSLDSHPDIDLILCDLRLPDGSGLDLLEKVNQRVAPPPVVLVTGQGDEQAAVSALKAGAADYLVKQSDYLLRLPVAISNAIAHSRLVREQAALREAQARFQTLVEQIPAAVYTDSANENNPRIYVSPQIEKIAGYPSEDWLKDPLLWKRLIHPDDNDRFLAEDRRTNLTGEPFNMEYRLVAKDGNTIWIHDMATLVRDETGKSIYWQGVLFDITKQREVDEAIRASEERFRRIFHSSPVATSVVTMEEGRFLDANLAFQDLTGASIEVLKGRTPNELSFWEQNINWVEFINQLSVSGSMRGVETRYTNVPGGPKDTLAYYEFITLDGRNCLLAMYYDVTEEKKAQTALQSERDFALQVLNTMGQGLTVTTEEGAYEYVNRAFAQMIGYAAEEIIGQGPTKYTAEEAMPVLLSEIERRRAGITSTYESLLLQKGGKKLPVVITGAPRLLEGKINGTIAVVTDLTAIKRAEASLARQVKELTVLHTAAMIEAEIAVSEDSLIEKLTAIIGQLYPELCGILLLNEAGDILTPHPSYLGAKITAWMEGYPITQGITGRAVQLGRSVRVPDVQLDPSYVEIASGIRSELCVPIRVNERIIGVLNVESKTPDAFDDGDERLLTTLAGGLGSALARIRLFEAEQRRIRELEIINKVSASLRVAQSLDEMLPGLIQETLALLNPIHVSIWLYDQIQSTLVKRVEQGMNNLFGKDKLKPGEGIIGRTFTIGEKITSREADATAPLSEGERAGIPAKSECISIPIQSTAGPVGVLVILIEDGLLVRREAINLLTILAEITGNAIHRTELFEHSQEQVRRLTTLRDIDSAIASSADLRVTLNILTDHALRHLKIDAVDILMYRPELQSLTLLCDAGFRTTSPSRPLMRAGEGLAGQIVIKGRIDHVIDLKNSPEAKKNPAIAREGFVTYIGVPLMVKGQIKGVFEVFHRSPLSPSAEWMQFLQTIAGQAAIAIDNAHLFDNLQKTNQELTQAYDITLEGWARALELRDRETEGHTRRVTDLTLRLAKTMGIKDDDLINIYRGVLLHDIGKMGVPDQILKKTGPLSEAEWLEMRKHPQYAYDLLAPIDYLRPALDIPLCHHEHWDGSGYPRGLKGTEIPLSARIFSVVDIWDALRSDRPYRKAWPRESVLAYVHDQAGKILDPEIVQRFLTLISEEE